MLNNATTRMARVVLLYRHCSQPVILYVGILESPTSCKSTRRNPDYITTKTISRNELNISGNHETNSRKLKVRRDYHTYCNNLRVSSALYIAHVIHDNNYHV